MKTVIQAFTLSLLSHTAYADSFGSGTPPACQEEFAEPESFHCILTNGRSFSADYFRTNCNRFARANYVTVNKVSFTDFFPEQNRSPSFFATRNDGSRYPIVKFSRKSTIEIIARDHRGKDVRITARWERPENLDFDCVERKNCGELPLINASLSVENLTNNRSRVKRYEIHSCNTGVFARY